MKDWAILAAKAKEIAKKIITGEEENKKGVRLIHIVERLDTFASNSLNAKFPQSKGSIHTYWGGNQVIDTKHSDGSKGHFNSNGTINSTDAPMDLEVSQYINSHLDESKSNKYMKKVINEAQLRQIVAESVKRVLNEKFGDDYDVRDYLSFIDKDEIEEMLGEYYNFSNVSDYAWKCIDNIVGSECERRGVSPTDYEAYAKICDGAVRKVLKSVRV